MGGSGKGLACLGNAGRDIKRLNYPPHSFRRRGEETSFYPYNRCGSPQTLHMLLLCSYIKVTMTARSMISSCWLINCFEKRVEQIAIDIYDSVCWCSCETRQRC